MGNQRLRILVLAIFIASVVLVAACTRSASTPPPSTGEEEPQSVQPVDDTQATMDAVRSAILTQTAQVDDGSKTGEETPGADLPAVTATPIITGTPPTAAESPSPTAGGITEYTVLPGDWIWKIARDFNVDPQEIIDLNGLSLPSQIKPGMTLQIPAPASQPAPTVTSEAPSETGTPQATSTVHTVQPGEWIWQIARLYNVDAEDIIAANNLTDPTWIYPGQELIIP